MKFKWHNQSIKLNYFLLTIGFRTFSFPYMGQRWALENDLQKRRKLWMSEKVWVWKWRRTKRSETLARSWWLALRCQRQQGKGGGVRGEKDERIIRVGDAPFIYRPKVQKNYRQKNPTLKINEIQSMGLRTDYSQCRKYSDLVPY